MIYAPIALFVYNRLSHTQQTVDALLKNNLANQSELFIFSDAPKTPEANFAVAQVRDYIKTISGFMKISVIERPGNFGLAKSVIDGVTQLCKIYGRAIVLEDDLITSPSFLEYMNDGLERYQPEEKVMQVAGYMFPLRFDVETDALFLPFISSWGWGTWQRAWARFDSSTGGYDRLINDSQLRKRFDLNGNYNYFKMLESCRNGKVDSWAIRWYLSVFLNNGLAVYPKKSLVKNIGFDGSGVNCGASKFAQDDLDSGFKVNIWPSDIKVSEHSNDIMSSIPKPALSLHSVLNRVWARLVR